MDITICDRCRTPKSEKEDVVENTGEIGWVKLTHYSDYSERQLKKAGRPNDEFIDLCSNCTVELVDFLNAKAIDKKDRF